MDSNDLFKNLMNQGHSAAWDQMWSRAAGFYQQALDTTPDHPEALLSLGMALYEMRDFPQALGLYQRVGAMDPEDPIPVEKSAQIYEFMDQRAEAVNASMDAAELYLKKSDVGKAIENWSRITRLEPDNLMAHSRLALTHEKQGRDKQAVTELIIVASLFQHAGDNERAVEVVHHALSILPESDAARQALAMLQSGQLLPKPAPSRAVTGPLSALSQPQIEATTEPIPEEEQSDPIEQAGRAALAELAGILFELSEDHTDPLPSRRGLDEITRGLDLKSRNDNQRADLLYRLRQAIDLHTRQEFEEAAEEFEFVHDLGLDLPAMHFLLGSVHAKIGRLESALRHLQRAVNHHDYALGARLVNGEILYQRSSYKNAAAEYLEALKIADSRIVDPEMARKIQQSYEPLIEAHIQEANDQDHQQLCANIKELLVRPDWRVHLEKARQELPVQEQGAIPLPLAEILTQAQSGEIVGSLAKIHQYARNGYLRLAMESAFYALDHAPTYLPLHSLMGDLLLQQNRIGDATTKFTVVAKAYSARGEAGRATDLFRRVVQLAPMELNSRAKLIEQLMVQGDIEGGLQEYIELADVHIRLAELDTARQTYEQAFQLAAQSNVGRDWSVRILHAMADIDLQRLDWRQALGVYEQIVGIEPGDEKARSMLIDLHLRMGQEKRAIEALEESIIYLETTGRPEIAIETLENLVTDHADYVPLREHLAQFYQKLGRRIEAIEQWDRVGEMLLDAGERKGAIRAIEAIVELNPPNAGAYQRLLDELSAG